VRNGKSNFDLDLLRYMRTHGHAPWAERAAIILSKAGENAYLWFGIGILGAVVDPDRRAQWLVAALVGPVSILINFALKLVFRRQRPVLEGLPPIGGAPSSLSFPSAHATASFASASVMTRIAPELGIPLFAIATLMAATRPYLGLHYPTDVLAGAGLGLIIGSLVPLPEIAQGELPINEPLLTP
jgi:membrane-associated phospholipid phosphatase